MAKSTTLHLLGGSGAGTDPALSDRVTALENKYVKATWFTTINSGTSGALSPPTGGAILLDQWAAGVDALASGIAGGAPTYQSPVTAEGVVVSATLDALGNWSLSGTPVAYPVCLIFAYKVKLSDFDHTKSLFEEELAINEASDMARLKAQIWFGG